MAVLTGGIAVVRVGETSEAKTRERRDRADDAVHALRAALAEGVVPGGGVALLNAAMAVEALEPTSREQKVGFAAVAHALEAPIRQIAENAGLQGSWIDAQLRNREDQNFGLDARSGELVDVSAAGIIDPARVVRTALRCGGSVASLLVATEDPIVVGTYESSERRAGLAGAT